MNTLTPRRIAATVAASLLGTMLGVVSSGFARDDDDKGNKGNDFSARLSGFNEVHFIAAPTPALRGAISTRASGTFHMKIDEPLGLVNYELTYQDLEGTVTQAHIHFGQRHTTGGITVWLCQTSTNPSPTTGTPTCPGPNSGTVTGTFTKDQVIAVTGQGIDAKEFDEVLRAIRSGTTYANVHSTVFAPGEIRGQIRHGGGHDKGKK